MATSIKDQMIRAIEDAPNYFNLNCRREAIRNMREQGLLTDDHIVEIKPKFIEALRRLRNVRSVEPVFSVSLEKKIREMNADQIEDTYREITNLPLSGFKKRKLSFICRRN